jgi:hypothetical protein
VSRASRQAWRSETKSAASDGEAGYSQSMSRPSRPRFLTRSTADRAKVDRPEGVEAGCLKLEE